MELWDLYNENRKKLGKTHVRGVPMEKGTFHLVVNIYVTNSKGELLVSQRHPKKTFPLQWEGSGGSVTTGENSYMGALRELEEEVGIIPNSMGILVKSEISYKKNGFNDVWFFHEDIHVENLKLQETEVVHAKWVTRNELIDMFSRKQMVSHLDYVLNYFYEDLIFADVHEGDIPYLLNLREKTMNPHLIKVNMPIDKYTHLNRINYHFTSGKIIYFKGEKIGFLKYKEKPDYLHLIQIQVDPKYQNRGFGKKLLEFILEKSHLTGKKIKLEVLRGNPAKNLYEKFGFITISENENSFEMVKLPF